MQPAFVLGPTHPDAATKPERGDGKKCCRERGEGRREGRGRVIYDHR
jgi:hypothetical protein